MFTDRDMKNQVTAALGREVKDFDVEAIVNDLIKEFGVIDLESIPDNWFWKIVEKHDKS